MTDKNRPQAGTKHDTQKPQPTLVLHSMSRAIQAVVEVATFGASKYSPDNWLLVPDGINRYRDAKLRHMLDSATEDCDTESGLLHAAHEAWNALAVLELMLRDAQAAQADPADWDAGEARMGPIGQNGNDGSHHCTLTLPEGVAIPESARFVTVCENGQMVAHDLKPALVQGCWHAAAGNQYAGLGDGSQEGLYERIPGDIWVRVEDL